MVERPALTLSEAAQACGVSRDTIKRRLNSGAFPNAFRGPGAAGEDTGPWLVPVTDLLAAGLHPNAPSAGLEEPQGPAPEDELERLRGEVEVQRHRAEVQLHRAELAEARLEERAQTIEALREALRRLPELPPASEPQPVPEDAQSAQQPRPGRLRRWFLGEI